MRLTKIISGGQTGVDRGALDAAIAAGVSHGGYCPQGRRAENGAIPPRYRLTEMESCDYAARTVANVETADATLILTRGKALSGGTRLTHRLAQSSGNPLRVVDLTNHSVEDVDAVRAWIVEHKIRVLNVAGPRESTAPGIQDEAKEFVGRLLIRRRRSAKRK